MTDPTLDEFNPQEQPKIVWPASVLVARAYLDQLDAQQGDSAGARTRRCGSALDTSGQGQAREGGARPAERSRGQLDQDAAAASGAMRCG